MFEGMETLITLIMIHCVRGLDCHNVPYRRCTNTKPWLLKRKLDISICSAPANTSQYTLDCNIISFKSEAYIGK